MISLAFVHVQMLNCTVSINSSVIREYLSQIVPGDEATTTSVECLEHLAYLFGWINQGQTAAHETHEQVL